MAVLRQHDGCSAVCGRPGVSALLAGAHFDAYVELRLEAYDAGLDGRSMPLSFGKTEYVGLALRLS